jgi:Flp pilus assembly protein TadD
MSGPMSLSELRAAAVEAHQGGKLDVALRHYARFLANHPGDGAIWSNLGALHRAEKRHDQAVRAHARAHALDPDAASVLNNYANALSDVGDYDRAIVLRRRLLDQAPGDVVQKALIGRALRGKGAYVAAIDWLDAAHAAHPDDAEIELQLAFALMGAGIYDRGFEAYRARWRTEEMKKQSGPVPKWRGEDLKGKTVLVMPEQGFGDAVLMMRFLPMLKERAAEVICLAERPMARLFAGLPGADRVVTELSRNARVDVYLNIMDLPRLGLSGRDDVPAPARLTVPEESQRRAQAITAPHRDRLRIGVNWSGSVTYRANNFRSFSHREYLPLTDLPGVQLFSLYKGPGLEAFRADGSDAFIVDAASSDRDFADCAGLMQEMDLIITSDTATAHVAGSLGLPTWVVLHWDSFWVYTHTGSETPWYPSMRLFRQPAPQDWETPLSQVRAALEARIAQAGGNDHG